VQGGGLRRVFVSILIMGPGTPRAGILVPIEKAVEEAADFVENVIGRGRSGNLNDTICRRGGDGHAQEQGTKCEQKAHLAGTAFHGATIMLELCSLILTEVPRRLHAKCSLALGVLGAFNAPIIASGSHASSLMSSQTLVGMARE
jgi:hypothetical protein